MLIHHLLIELSAKTRKLNIPPELETWLLSEYGWEAVDDLMDASELMDVIEMHCRQYWNSNLDITPLSEAELWKNRAETAKFILTGINDEKDHLLSECERLMKLLDDHGIEY